MGNAKILCAITSFNRPAYVDLSLHYLLQWGKDLDVIVLDDCSGNKAYEKICEIRRIPVMMMGKRHSHGKEDLSQIIVAMKYAEAKGYEYLIKQSQRWICLENPADSLKSLIELSGGFAFANETKSYGFKFRTEFFCVKVHEWMRHLDFLKRLKNSSEEPQVERTFHDLALKTQPDSPLYMDYQKRHGAKFGYVAWDWMGDDRRKPPKHILWHDAHKPSVYFQKSKEAGLPWSENDFK